MIQRIKTKLFINDYNISLESEVAIDHDEKKISDDEILTVLKKSGKEVSLK